MTAAPMLIVRVIQAGPYPPATSNPLTAVRWTAGHTGKAYTQPGEGGS